VTARRQQKARPGHQRARDRDHLLLAARQRASRCVEARGKHREELADPRQRTRPLAPGGRDEAAELEIFANRHSREQPPALGYNGDAMGDEPMRR
jgi:hypothetical protein